MNYEIYNEDCLEGMKRIPDGSVDMILDDLPYNVTDCAWDKSVIDLAAMWQEFKRILKPYCCVALFASGKFTHKLIASNLDWYKYKWIWIKNAPTMFVQAKNAPMRKFEEILIFSDGVMNHASCSNRRMKYNPQGLAPCAFIREPDEKQSKPSQLRAGGRGKQWSKTDKNATKTQIHNPHPENIYVQEQTGYPADVLYYDVEPSNKKLHPTQKPVPLLEYLIRTYTNEGETVLDATCGSGSTGVACINTGRRFIGFETDAGFYEIAEKRLTAAESERAQNLFAESG